MTRTSITRHSLLVLIIVGFVIGIWKWYAFSHTTALPLEVTLTPSSLAEQADLILVGTFKKTVRQRIETDTSAGKVPLTDWLVEPKEVWKGTAPASLNVTVFGGKIGLNSFRDEHFRPRPGQEALMYLDYISEKSAWVFLSTTQGYFTEQNGKFVTPVNRSFGRAELKAEVDKVNARSTNQ